MQWITPKTDWKIQLGLDGQYQGDYFEIADYQRICNNLNYLHKMAAQLWNQPEKLQMVNAEQGDFCTAEMMNGIEQAIQTIKPEAFSSVILPSKTWKANDFAPMVHDLNRIEKALQNLYLLLLQQQNVLPKLAIKLGGGRF